MKVLDLFSGIGGFSLGLERAGMETVAFCEFDKHAQKVLKKHWPDVPIFEDVRTLDGKQFRGSVDVVCGGFPCQDLSQAGVRSGFEGERSSLYREMLRVISECLPRYAIFENVPGLLTGESGKWFAKFLYDLAEIGYDATWANIPVSRFREEHTRHRIWIVAYPSKIRRPDYRQIFNNLANETPVKAGQTKAALGHTCSQWLYAHGDLRDLRKDDGISGAVDRIGSLGNAVDPKIPELLGQAWLDYITHPQTDDALDDASPSL